MKILKAVVVAFAILASTAVLLKPAHADSWDKETKITFSQPVEVPGRVLPAGTYTFKINRSPMLRSVVHIFSEDGTKIIATLLTIPDYTLTPTDETVINFKELSSGAPAAVRAWFYPGEQYGREFVYPKKRAVELASQQNVPVPAEQTEAANPNLETVPLVAEMPGNKEEPITQAIQTAPPRAEEPLVAQTTPTEAALPKTASPIPLLVLGGLISLGLGLGLKLFARQR